MAIGGRAHPQIKWPDCRVVLEPTSSPMITKGHSGNHRVEGVSVGFAPPLLDQQLYDEAHTIPEADARSMCRRLAKEEGLLVGTSSGLNVTAAIQLAKDWPLRRYRQLGETYAVQVYAAYSTPFI